MDKREQGKRVISRSLGRVEEVPAEEQEAGLNTNEREMMQRSISMRRIHAAEEKATEDRWISVSQYDRI